MSWAVDYSLRCLAGAAAIAHALTKNTTLEHLDVRLNRIGDEGGQAICRYLIPTSIPVDSPGFPQGDSHILDVRIQSQNCNY